MALGYNPPIVPVFNENVIASALVVVWPFGVELAITRQRSLAWWQRLDA